MNVSPGTLRHLKIFGGAALLLFCIAGAWRFTPLHHYADPKVIGHLFRGLRDSVWFFPAVLLAYLLASLTLFPNTVLNGATILALGTTLGPPTALAGSMVAATAFYVLGRGPARERLKQIRIRKLDQLNAMMRRGGILGMATLRLVPVAPYAVVNLMSGAARVKPLDFVLGTFLGLLPGCLLVTAFGHQLRALMKHPGPAEAGVLAAVAVFAVLTLWGLQRKLSRTAAAPEAAPSSAPAWTVTAAAAAAPDPPGTP